MLTFNYGSPYFWDKVVLTKFISGCRMVWDLICGTSRSYKSRTEKVTAGRKSAILPNWCCLLSIRGRPQRTSAIFRGGGGSTLQTFADSRGEGSQDCRRLQFLKIFRIHCPFKFKISHLFTAITLSIKISSFFYLWLALFVIKIAYFV